MVLSKSVKYFRYFITPQEILSDNLEINCHSNAHARQAYGINAAFPATVWILSTTGNQNADMVSSRAELALGEHRGRDCRYRNADAAAGQQEEPQGGWETAAPWHRLTEKLPQHQGDGYSPWQRDLKVPDFGGCKTDLVHVLHSSNPEQLWGANDEGGEKSRESISHLSDEGTAGDKSPVRDPLGMVSKALIPSLLKSIFPPLKFSTAN